jgi:capsular polysaccharide biosynthesis protein
LKEFFRNICLKILRLFKPYREYFRLPEGEINYNGLNSTADLIYLQKHETIKRTVPLTIDAVIHPKFTNQLNETPPETFVIKAKSWSVWGNQGAVITDDGFLFSDVSREFNGKEHSIFKQFKLVPAKVIKGLTTVLAASGSNVYYHWMFDIIPRIRLLKESGKFYDIEHFVINYTQQEFQQQTMERAEVDLSKIIAAGDHWNFHLKAEELIVPSLPSNNDSPSYEACLYLRSLYKEELSTGGTKKIYIKRLQGRYIVNEDELLKILQPLGFEIINAELLTVAQQAAIFSKAEIVIGAHGAGLTNLVFCNPGTRVIDIFSPKWINTCYWILSNHLNLRYAYLVGESLKEKGMTDKGSNILVDIPKFNKLLNYLYA